MKLSISLDRFDKTSCAELSVFDTDTQVLTISKDACWKAGEKIKIDRSNLKLTGEYSTKTGKIININSYRPKWSAAARAFLIEKTLGSWPMSPKYFRGKASWSFDLGCGCYITISRKCARGSWGEWEINDSER